jgi:hypothetical protein
MNEFERQCPFLVPVVADLLWLVRTTAYCRAADRVRLPASKTFIDRCLDAFHDYPGYRAHMENNPSRRTS